MRNQRETQKLALQGGLRAVAAIAGRGQPKIGVAEFMSVAERFGFSHRALRGIRSVLNREKIGAGPYLANYYSGLKETKVQAYERKARELFGVKYAIGVSSGTAALHAAFVAAGVGPGTEVICPAIGFYATAAAVVMAKGVPIFCDVDESLGLNPLKLARLITPRTVAIAPTHVMGAVCNMGAIMKIARRHKLRVIEDCAQSCGARFKGRYVGTIGDLGCFSISAYKIVGGGEGGLILTDDKRLWERAMGIVECGGLWRPERFAQPRYPGELFCGTNYRMSELEAAVDVVQLGKVDATVRRFHAVKQMITRRLTPYREIAPQICNDPAGEVGYTLRFFPATASLAVRIVTALKAEGIACGTRGPKPAPDWHIYSEMQPLLVQGTPTEVKCPFECPVYRRRGGPALRYRRGNCPVADDLYNRMVTINLNQWYTTEDCRHVAEGITKVLDAYCKKSKEGRSWR